MLLPFFPRPVGPSSFGSGRGEESSGENVLSLIQIRLATASLAKISPAGQAQSAVSVNRNFKFEKRRAVCARPLRNQTHREVVYRPLRFHKRSEFFIGAHDETLLINSVKTALVCKTPA